jgi:FAD/FMN-containing dehydrogenase
MDEFLSALKASFKGDIDQTPATLETYSHDTSLFEIKPLVVLYPKDAADIEHIVATTNQFKSKIPNLSLTPRSGGTDMSGGSVNDSVIVDFSRYFKKIGDVDPNGTTVEPGVYYRDFEKETLKKGVILPSYPASREICCVGGMVNNNSGGERSLIYGKTINYVTSLDVILSDGKLHTIKPLNRLELESKLKEEGFEGDLYRKIYDIVEKNYEKIKAAKPNVSKNSTGYNVWDVWNREVFDMTKLFVGGQGTLGMVTQAQVKLVPQKKFASLLVIYLNDLKKVPEIIHLINPLKPDCFEAFDKHTMKLAIQFMFKFIQVLGMQTAIKMGMQFFPDLIKFAMGGIPEFTLLVEFEGDTQQEIDDKLKTVQEHLKDFEVDTVVARTRSEAKGYWTIRRESFNLLRKNVKNKHTAPFIDDFIVPPDCLLEFFPKLIAICEKYELLYTIAGHMGDGNFHIIPLMDLRDPKERAKIIPAEKEVIDLILQYKGSMSGEHNDGIIRGPFLEHMYGHEIFGIFKQVKDIFDPEKIFNPHKKTEATIEFIESHMRDHF